MIDKLFCVDPRRKIVLDVFPGRNRRSRWRASDRDQQEEADIRWLSSRMACECGLVVCKDRNQERVWHSLRFHVGVPADYIPFPSVCAGLLTL